MSFLLHLILSKLRAADLTSQSFKYHQIALPQLILCSGMRYGQVDLV